MATYLARHPEGGWLDPLACAKLLGSYGIPQLPWEWATDEDQAVAAAARLAGPDGRVVVKAHWPGLLYKSERGAIHLDLMNASQVRAAYRDLDTRFGDVLSRVVVQPLAERGTELVTGAVQDEVFGPRVLFGLGGTATELLGYRGARPVDLRGLEQLLLRLSRMACDLPRLAEAECNPVLARPGGVTTFDVRVRLEPCRARNPHLRRTR